MVKRKDECLFCTSRNCFERVVSTDNGNTYDEISCIKHTKDLYKDADSKSTKIMKNVISSTGRQKRGQVRELGEGK